jgi:hypothetical protein
MRLDFVFWAKAADQVAGCFSTLSAGFDGIGLPTLPGIAGPISVVMRLIFTPQELGQHELRVRMVDPNGEQVGPDQVTPIVAAPNKRDASAETGALIVMTMPVVEFRKKGRHELSFQVDGVEAGTLSLHVDSANVEEVPG